MKKKLLTMVLTCSMAFALCVGCGQTAPVVTNENATEEVSEVPAEENVSTTNEEANAQVLEDGVYDAKFTTDSNMFHINEMLDDMGTLTVENGEMTIHITLPSKSIVNLFPGTAEDAQKEGAVLLEPTVDKVTYEDGTTEEVHGFDVPVPVIDEEFDLALIGTKEKWYNHKVMVSEVKPHETDADKEAADAVAELIDQIYAQTWTEETEAQCAAAKAGWDALTDEQKELVEGDDADPDYFGRDTGDASKDDPLNGDEIGDKEILVVSFGTSFNDSRAEDIGGIEKAIAKAYPDWSVRRAFTAQIIINHVMARDGEKIDNVDQALQRAIDNGVSTLVIQPTHLMHGAEYDELVETLKDYEDKIENVAIAEPLLGEVGKDASVINEDKEAVAKAITAAAVKEAGFDSLDAAKDASTAFVFMGHGTSHTAKVTYSQMQTQMDELGYENVFIGTVEGEPEETELSEVINKVKEAGYKNVILRPLMVVAGDHANNDMAGDDEDSWKSGFLADGSFDSVECQISGLGRIEDVQKLYVEHTGSVLK
jgi:cobalamin biosynthesis Co2+ chelatase CbiK